MALRRGISIALIVGAVAITVLAVPSPLSAACPVDSSFCRGCGCKGGPGWRHIATGRCVGFRELAAKCGDPPSEKLCTFENARGTGANRACALAPATPPPDDDDPPRPPPR